MTIIVVVKNDDKTIIGTDKRLMENNTIVSENASKILIKNLPVQDKDMEFQEEFLIAFSGLYTLFELLKTFTVPLKSSEESFFEYLYRIFIPQLNEYFAKYYFKDEYNGHTGVDRELIIAYKTNVFVVEYNLGICEINTPYYATGAARDIALGSLYTYHNDHSHPVERFMVEKAIKACAAHNNICNNNIELYSITKEGDIKQIK